MNKRTLLPPDELKEKALRQYRGFLSAWLSGTAFFPLHIPGIGAQRREGFFLKKTGVMKGMAGESILGLSHECGYNLSPLRG